MSSEDYKTLIRTRKFLRCDVTRTFNKIMEGPDSIPVDDIEATILRLNELQVTVNELNRDVMKCLVQEDRTDDDINREYDLANEYKNKLLKSITILKSRVSVLTAPVHSNTGNNELPNARKLKLPQIQLPTYGHKDGEDLNTFFMNFDNIVNKYNLADNEKFIYLQGQLSGDPLNLIKSLDIASQGYTIAKDLLTRAFASKITQQFETIKRLTELKFSMKSPYDYIGKLRQIRESFKNLQIDTDMVMQYFYWLSMPELLQTQFVAISNSSKPSLAEIDLHMFDAMERFLDAAKKGRVKKDELEVNNYAVSMNAYKPNEGNAKQQYCSLCSSAKTKDTSHSTFNCPNYNSTFEKLDRLKSVNGCLKCGNTTHDSKACMFRFKRTCFNCGKFHFTFLCPDNIESKHDDRKNFNNSNDKKPAQNFASSKKVHQKPDKKVNASSIWVNETTFDNAGHDAILPTFTVNVGGKTIRAMRDSGCQASFIVQALADELNLKVAKEEFELGVNGFNSSRKIKTTVVELSIRENEPPISMICIPDIRINLDLPGLSSIVTGFTELGYVLADTMLQNGTDNIADIGMIIGDNEAQIVPQSDETFGIHPKSMYANTPLGVMLLGSIERMTQNLPYLPNNGGSLGKINSTTCCPSTIASSSDVTSEPMLLQKQFNVIDQEGNVDQGVLNQALDAALREQCENVLAYDQAMYEDNVVEVDKALVDHVVRNTTRAEDGRLRMPLMWNTHVSDRLANNYALSKAVLKSNLAKLSKSPKKLQMYDQVIKEQEALGVIERVDHIESYIREHPTCSFLCHMGVFRMDNDSTKCRVVYLSNLADRKANPRAVSHNQAIVSGPCLNKKISTSICEIRFDKFLLCFDIVKAFLNIELYPTDQDKLMFLWYRDAPNGDYTIVAYKSVRLAFGLRASPCTLAIALYVILIDDAKEDEEELRNLKQLIYSLIYVDNGAVTANSASKLEWAYQKLNDIFNPYQFYLQKFATNSKPLQSVIDGSGDETPTQVKLLGLAWDRTEDTIFTQPLHLDREAKSKRAVLSSIASNYDIFQMNGPILNRAKLFMHGLQCDKTVNWDDTLSGTRLNEWGNICKQVNSSPPIELKRYVGRRDGTYNLVACTDASKLMYASVIYIQDCADGSMHFLAAKNRLVNKQLEAKTIPCLEFQAISLGVEMLLDYHNELCGEKTDAPIKIESLKLLSDSMVALNWLYASCHKLDKMQKLSPFVKNRLNKICQLCEQKSITFNHVPGERNPADCLSRCVSHRQMLQTNFLTGPDSTEGNDESIQFAIPATEQIECSANVSLSCQPVEPMLDITRFSSLDKLVRTQRLVLAFINKLKIKVNAKYSRSMQVFSDEELQSQAWNIILRSDQEVHYLDVLKFFRETKHTPHKDVPPIVTQLNLYLDKTGVLRVQSKFDRWADHQKYLNPILLAKKSHLTSLVVLSIHHKKGHTGVYNILNEFRRKFYVPQHFSVVKKLVKNCVTCRRVNGRTISLTQNKYRDFRASPPSVAFRSIFVDHCGPYLVKRGGTQSKVWVLCITCLFSRAVNLKLCLDLTTGEFLKALQMHIFEYGTPELVLSDLGSQIVAGGNVIAGIMNDATVTSFLAENDIRPMTFQHYAKGCNELGGIVESCVKLTKRMIYGCIGKQILDVFDFIFVLAQAVCLINKRPIAFREALRDDGCINELPAPITPEVLIKGHDLVTLNILPGMPVDIDPDWSPNADVNAHIRSSFEKLNKNREKLIKIYENEFRVDLTRQATNLKNRYMKVPHQALQIDDIVLLKEPNIKSINFPMGIVKKVVTNDLGEVTEAILLKGNKEKVRRHVKSLIILMRRETPGELQSARRNDADEFSPENSDKFISVSHGTENESHDDDSGPSCISRPVRKAATRCRKRMSSMATQHLL